MNGKALIPLIAGLGIGGIALWMGFKTLRAARGNVSEAPAATVQVLCPKEDIPRLSVINEEMLETKSYPANAMPEGAFATMEELIGRVPKVEAPAGLPILESMLLPPGSRGGLYVKPGYRAVAVRIDASSGVDYHLEPGAYVDVLGSFAVRRNGRGETLATTVLENVEIAAVGPRLSPVMADGSTSSRTVRAVTLFVKPNDMPRLLLAEQKGRIKLGLRSEQDADRLSAIETISDRELTGEKRYEDMQTAAPEPASETTSLLGQLASWWEQGKAQMGASAEEDDEPDPWTVRIIRGTQEETVEFADRDSSEPAAEDARAAPTARRPEWDDEPSGDVEFGQDDVEVWEPEELEG